MATGIIESCESGLICRSEIRAAGIAGVQRQSGEVVYESYVP
jgi:hypothetical protein